jgi:serine/threonine protein kinase
MFLIVTFFRIFSHPNILPVIGCCNAPPDLVVISQYMPFGSLYNVLHQSTNVVVDSAQALRFALDIARGMAYFHGLEKFVPNFYLNSFHIMVSVITDFELIIYSIAFKPKFKTPIYISDEVIY